MSQPPKFKQMPTFKAQKPQQGFARGSAAPPDPQQPFGTQEGNKSPGFDSIRGASDVAGTMATYQNELVRVLTSMQSILLETISRLEAIENRFDRMR
jgi:hypothetical protein